jgi:predicted secreted Zn-dependent protease
MQRNSPDSSPRSVRPCTLDEYKAVWKTYYDKLLGHELGHVAICADTAKRVRNALESMPTAPKCDGIHQGARRRATKVIENMQSKQEKYDSDSEGGRREY